MLLKLQLTMLLVVFLSFSANASERAVAVIKSLESPFDLAPFIETIEDRKREYTVTDIVDGRYDHLWKRNTAPHFIGANSESKYWFRVNIRWDGIENQEGVLFFNSQPVLLQRLTVILPTTEKPNKTIRVGQLEPFGARPLSGYQYAFPHQLTKGNTQTVIGWASHASFPVQLPFILLSKEDLADRNQIYYGILIGFYTLMAALIIYNSCLFITLRQPVYGIYILFLSSAVLSCMALDGTASRFLWPTTPSTLNRVSVINGMLTAITYFIFIVMALNGVRRWPIFNKIYWGMLLLGLLGFLHNLLTMKFNAAFDLIQIYATMTVNLILIVVMIAIRKGLPTAVYLFVAEVLFIAGSTAYLLLLKGILPINSFTMWGAHWGYAVESLLLSLALAARTRIFQQLAIDSQRSAIESLEKYQKIYNDAVEGLFQYDFKSKTLKSNDALAKLFGFKNGEELPVNSNILSYFSPEVQEELPKILAEKGTVLNYEAEIDAREGLPKKWVSMTVRLVKNSNGEVVETEGSMIDITERKLKEEAEKQQALAKKSEEMSQANNKAKTQFFASMSHEFRTPLTAILGYTKIAKADGIDENERINHLHTIENSAEYMLQLINDVLDLSKIEAQKLDVETIPVDLFNIVTQVEDFIYILALNKNISFKIDYHFPLPATFISDPTRLKQALINLCSNAVKFTEKGGVVLRISCDEQKEFLTFEIEDTGIGIRADHIERLFKAFTQVDSSTTRSYGGTGLGLHLSKLIANKLGGDITIESEYGRGSTFTLGITTGKLDNVSWHTEAIQRSKPETINAITHTNNIQKQPTVDQLSSTLKDENLIHVLLAEDNIVNQTLMKVQIAKLGANVTVVSDGLEAIAHVLTEDYQLILMDMEMPTMDGLTTVKYLREKGVKTPIYALTGNVSKESINECDEAGCNGHFSKPIDTDKLKSIIENSRQP